jgi:hypothetical protein
MGWPGRHGRRMEPDGVGADMAARCWALEEPVQGGQTGAQQGQNELPAIPQAVAGLFTNGRGRRAPGAGSDPSGRLQAHRVTPSWAVASLKHRRCASAMTAATDRVLDHLRS